MKERILNIKNLRVSYNTEKTIFSRQEKVIAVNDINLTLYKGETLGLVGESGCGKSSTGKSLVKLIEAESGEVIYKDNNILKVDKKSLKDYRKEVQYIFQDPYASLNPKHNIQRILSEAFKEKVDKKKKSDKLIEILDKVGLNKESLKKYPHEFSGGQRQRIVIARALVAEPNIIIADEPVSALDVSIQAQIINLLKKIQKENSLTYLFISHDLSVVKYISDRVAVMYLGNIVEVGEKNQLFKNPLHPYTEALISAIPTINNEDIGKRIVLEGDVPNPSNPPSGCPFHTRCIKKISKCTEVKPELIEVSNDYKVACHLYN